jgi:DNA ligase-1
MIKDFKPNLFPNEKVDLSKIKYPVLVSKKLDGIRTIFKDGKMLSRSLKEIPSKQLQNKFQYLKDYSKFHNIILDGELYGLGISFQEITHFVMTEDLDLINEKIPSHLNFFCFDMLREDINKDFNLRYEEYSQLNLSNLVIVKQKLAYSKKEVEEMFEDALINGFEGLILKSPTSKYKFGRTTFKSGDGYKVKPFITIDSKIISVEERFENTSESYTNELGLSQKHNFKDNKESTGIAACFVVIYDGFEQRVMITGNEDFRKEIWQNKENYIGKMIEFKGMIVGSKERIRHPVFIRFREDK